jgi:hypothetical protein
MAVPLKFAIPFLLTLGLCIGASCGYAALYAIANTALWFAMVP